MTEIKKEDVEIKEEDKTIHFQEMQESMAQAINNINDVINKQQLLLGVIEKSDKVEEFKQFIEDTKKQIEYYEEQRGTLITQVEELNWINVQCEKDETIKLVLTRLINILGLFK